VLVRSESKAISPDAFRRHYPILLAVFAQVAHFSSVCFGLCFDTLDVSGFSVAGIAAQDDQLGVRVKDGGRKLLIERGFNVGFEVVAASAAGAGVTLTVESEEFVEMGIMVFHEVWSSKEMRFAFSYET
jgi:hypothetical protein